MAVNPKECSVYRYRTKATSKTDFCCVKYEPPPIWAGDLTSIPAQVKAGIKVEYGAEFPTFAYKADMLSYGGLFLHKVPATSTFTQGGSAALSGHAHGGTTTHGLIGVLGIANPGMNGVYVFGGNFRVSNCDRGAPYTTAGATVYTGCPFVVGCESDTNNHSATTGICASFMAASAGTQKGLIDAAFFAAMVAAPAVRRGHGLFLADGSCEVGLMIGTATTGNSQNSAGIQFKSRDAGAVDKYGTLTQSHTGAMQAGVPAGGVFQVVDLGNAQVIGLRPTSITYQGGVFDTLGSGSPEGVVTAPIGSTYRNTAGGASTTLYVKTSGAGNTGWTAK